MPEPSNFTVTADHIKLVQAMNLKWEERMCGAPYVDPKRPYGSGDHLAAIAKIITEDTPICPHCSEVISDSDRAFLERMHQETLTVLRILLDTGRMIPGDYTFTGDGWRENIPNMVR